MWNNDNLFIYFITLNIITACEVNEKKCSSGECVHSETKLSGQFGHFDRQSVRPNKFYDCKYVPVFLQ